MVKLPWSETYTSARLLALIVIPSLTAHTVVDLARQLQRSRGVSRLLWLAGGSVTVALGLWCITELANGQVGGSDPAALRGYVLQAACTLAGCAWMLFTLGRRNPHTLWVLGTSLVLALGTCTLGDMARMLHVRNGLIADELYGLSFLVAVAAAYLFLKIGALAKLEERSWSMRTLTFVFIMGLLLAGSLVFVTQATLAVSRTSTHDYLAAGLPLTALCCGTVAVLVITLAATGISRQNLLRSTELQQSLDDQRMRDALADQRVTRLQNEALLQEIQERRNAEDKLRYAAFHDAATGLENRAYITETLTELLRERRAQRRPGRSAVILLHLDDLNTVSSLVGHLTVEMALLELTRRLKRFVTTDHVLARVGDDKFLLLMKQVPAVEQALRKANLMLSGIEESIAMHGAVVNLSASVGVCEISSSHMRADDVLRDAELAVEVARRDGGRQCKQFDVAMRDEALNLQQLKLELKTAVERDEFVLYYQPLVDMRDRSIYGMEALIRWNHPTKGLVTPGAFIPLSEETGQILKIGEWTLRNACCDFARLQAATTKNLLLSVNVSPRQLFETPFLKLVRAVLAETLMPPGQLQLEVTESIFLKDASSVGALLQEIRSMGIKIAFDDFGTGYSSLSYLTRYPIDTLKVDQSFVRAMNQSEGGANLVLFLMGLALEFSMSVTAEGVEALEQEAALLKQGCCFAQGFLYSRPVPLESLIQLLQQGLNLGVLNTAQGAGQSGKRPILATTITALGSPKAH